MEGEPDYGPLLLLGVAGIVGLAISHFASGSGSKKTMVKKPPPPSVPHKAAPAPPSAPSLAASSSADFYHAPPLFLWILQDGASDWTPIGWFYGHAGKLISSGHVGIRDVWVTPEGEVKAQLDTLRDEGIAGYFDTIEPIGVEDRNFKGRIDQTDDETRGVWFWVEETDITPAHYEAENAHAFTEYLGLCRTTRFSLPLSPKAPRRRFSRSCGAFLRARVPPPRRAPWKALPARQGLPARQDRPAEPGKRWGLSFSARDRLTRTPAEPSSFRQASLRSQSPTVRKDRRFASPTRARSASFSTSATSEILPTPG